MQRQLQESLYREHLEEISFLYTQREQWLDDPEVSLADVAALEERLEAHVDALVVGDAHALRVCQAWIPEADFGELHGAIRVFCRQQRLDLVRAALEQARSTTRKYRGVWVMRSSKSCPPHGATSLPPWYWRLRRMKCHCGPMPSGTRGCTFLLTLSYKPPCARITKPRR